MCACVYINFTVDKATILDDKFCLCSMKTATRDNHRHWSDVRLCYVIINGTEC